MSPRAPDTRPVFAISVAAELSGMHPQTLRVYERRGLVAPRRTPGNARLYSEADLARLRRIQGLSEAGLNLAGVERVLGLEQELDLALRRVATLERALAAEADARRGEVEAMRRALSREIVHVRRASGTLVPRVSPVIPAGLRPAE